MAKKLIEEQSLINIANAIREKTGDGSPLSVSAMPSAIEGIETGGGGSSDIISYIHHVRITSQTQSNPYMDIFLTDDNAEPITDSIRFGTIIANNEIERGNAILGSYSSNKIKYYERAKGIGNNTAWTILAAYTVVNSIDLLEKDTSVGYVLLDASNKLGSSTIPNPIYNDVVSPIYG